MDSAPRDAERAETGSARGADGVKLHYLAQGAGPLMVLLHGFPDDHRTWEPIVPALAKHFRVVTPDLRGYCDSDKPVGVEHYRMEKLVGDAIGVIDHFGARDAVVVGHDWGGAIAQNAALYYPNRVRRLILLNMPHLNGLRRELAFNPRQQVASAYARFFQDFSIEPPIDWLLLAEQLLVDRASSPRALDVLRRSDVTGLLDYYRANYPRPPYRFDDDGRQRNITVPTLILFGLDDPYVLSDCLRDNQQWFDRALRVVEVSTAGHWVHHAEPDLVARTMLDWLERSDESL